MVLSWRIIIVINEQFEQDKKFDFHFFGVDKIKIHDESIFGQWREKEFINYKRS